MKPRAKRHNYTYEEIKWAKEAGPNYMAKDFAKLFNERYGTDINWQTLQRRMYDYGVKFKSIMFSKEQVKWLEENSKFYTTNELVIKLKEIFNEEFKETGIRKHLEANNLDFKKRHHTKIKNEHREWVKSVYENYIKNDILDWDLLTRDFQKKFNVNPSSNTVKHLFYTNNLRTNHKTNNPHPKEIGHEMKWRDDIYVKVANIKHAGMKNFKRKATVVYEAYTNDTVGEDEFVVQLDGDKDNYAPENLFKVKTNSIRFVKHSLDIDDAPEIKKILLLDAQLREILNKEEMENEQT